MALIDVPLPAAAFVRGLVYRAMAPVRDDALLGCGFMRKPDGDDGAQHGRTHFSAVLVLRGKGIFRSGGTTWDLRPGSLFLRFAGRPHDLAITAGGEWCECWIALGVQLAAALEAHRVIDRRTPVLTTGIDPTWIHELLAERDALAEAADRELPYHLVRLQSLLMQVLAQARAPAADGPGPASLVERACRRLMDDPRADLARLAKDAGLSYERFRKVFREQTGVAPGEYRIRRRLERARALLLDGRHRVQEVAAELGYPNAYAFSAQFRKLVGVAPSGYRRGLTGPGR